MKTTGDVLGLVAASMIPNEKEGTGILKTVPEGTERGKNGVPFSVHEYYIQPGAPFRSTVHHGSKDVAGTSIRPAKNGLLLRSCVPGSCGVAARRTGRAWRWRRETSSLYSGFTCVVTFGRAEASARRIAGAYSAFRRRCGAD